MKDNGEVEFLDLFNPKQPRSDADLREERLAICRSCKYFYPKLQKCLQCGCVMPLKTRLKNASCPIHKW